MARKFIIADGISAVAYISYWVIEIILIYPITPSKIN